MRESLSQGDAARRAGVSRQAIRNWMQPHPVTGVVRLNPYRPNGKGPPRVLRAELDAVIRARRVLGRSA